MDIFTVLFSIFWYYALLLIVIRIYHILYFFYKHYIRQGFNLIERYGSNSWVVITGATDGIGKGFAVAFAKLGFNLVLISRTEKKLEDVKDEIERLTNHSISIRIVKFDFSEKTTIEDYNEMINKFSDLDVSVLINNVGWTDTKRFHKFEGKEIQDHININVVPQGLLTSLLLQKLYNRSKRSAIINLSSFASGCQAVGMIPYNAVKAFNNTHSKLCSYELKEKIDCISVKPMYVESPLTKVKADFWHVITTEQLCDSVIRQVGHEIETFGHPKHDWQASLSYWLIPSYIGRKFFYFNNNYTY